MTTPSPEVVGLMVRLGDALGQATRPASQVRELQRIVTSVRSLLSAAACSCALLEQDQSSLRFVVADGAGGDQIIGVTMPVGTGIGGWAMMSGQPILVADVAEDVRFNREVAEATSYVPNTILAAPMIDDAGDALGVIEVLDPAGDGTHTGRDLDVLAVLASVAASVVRLAGVYDALGVVLVQALAGSTGVDDFGDALAEVVSSDEHPFDLAGLARSFHALASLSPEGALLAERLLGEVARYAEAHRDARVD